MRTLLLTVFTLYALLPLHSKAIEPVSEYKTFSALTSTDTLYKWVANVSETPSVIFLTTKQAYKDAQHDGSVPSWTIYLPINNGSDYTKLNGLRDQDGVADVSDAPIDPERMFIGQITQLGKKGIVTAQIDRPRKGDAVAYIYAYTLEGSYMRQTLLTKYAPDKRNVIYEQYLSDNRRTKIVLQEINP